MATPANYTTQVKKHGRKVQWLVEIDLDRCSLVYTQGDCIVPVDLGDGSRCFYTFGTCQKESVFAKTTTTFRFCLTDIPWTDQATLCWPLLRSNIPVPQKIKEENLSTYPEKVKATFNLDWSPLPVDRDKGDGFHNTTTAGEFFKNLVARNRNYSGRPFRIKRGFSQDAGYVLADFDQIGPTYLIRSIEVFADKAVVTAESPLVELEKNQVPWTLSEDNTLTTAMNASVTTLVMPDTSEVPDPADYARNEIYIEVGPKGSTEIMRVSSIDNATDLSVTRGAFGTTARSHLAGVRIIHVACFGNTDGTAYPVTDALQDLLEWSGASGKISVDTSSFTLVSNTAWPNSDVLRKIRSPKKIAQLVQEIRDVRGIVIYINNDGQFAGSVIGPNVSAAVIDDDSLLDDSVEVKEDDEQRVSRVSYFYDPVDDSSSSSEDFGKKVVVINTDLEQANNFADERDHQVKDMWLAPSTSVASVRNAARRFITRRGYGIRTIKFKLDIKDAVNVGDSRTLITRHITDSFGNMDPRPVLIISKKEVGRSHVEYVAVDANFSGRYLRFGPDTMAATYDTATVDDRAYGYWGDADNRVGATLVPGYVFW